MCGIAGIYHYGERDRAADGEVLRRMTRRLAHRGPDGEGFFLDGPLGLGHRRLSIVDLSPTGDQPMPSGDGGAWLCYNGEFYNHAGFRRRLEARGVRFRGTCDTETMLYLLREEGVAPLAEVSGIFGFAYWDAARAQLVLARDALGVKQVYYHDNGRRVVFASEIKALLECPDVPREPDPQAINEYLHFHSALFERTFLKDVRQVLPGEAVTFGERGMSRQAYWRLDDFARRGGSPAENTAALRECLETVVGDQLMADVPTGAFFSGGIDSSAVASFSTRAGHRPQCFGVHFTGQGVIDERPYQEAAARALGLELNLVTLDGSTFPEDLSRLIYHQDQPVIGHAMFPMDRVSRLAAGSVKVCLGGQGADEIFGGYARYALTHPWKVLGGLVERAPAPTDPGAERVGGSLWRQMSSVRNLRRLARNAVHFADWRTRYFETYAVVPERLWRGVIADPAFVSRRHARTTFDDTLNRSSAVDPADKVMHWDVQTFLTGLFHQDDRISMAWSLESRVPLADRRLVEFAFKTPFDLKVRNGATKWLLRNAVADVLPASVLNRRKVGFDTPAAQWMKGQHAGYVRDLLLSSQARSRGLWDARGLERMLDRPGHPLWFDVIWKAACVETWARVFLDGEMPAAAA